MNRQTAEATLAITLTEMLKACGTLAGGLLLAVAEHRQQLIRKALAEVRGTITRAEEALDALSKVP